MREIEDGVVHDIKERRVVGLSNPSLMDAYKGV